MPYMYILECSDGSYYTGSTKDLEKRLLEHQNGLAANHTSKRLPVKLVYFEQYERVEDAFLREKQVQGWSRRKKLALIEGKMKELVEFSRNYTQYGNSTYSVASETHPSTSSGSGGTVAEPVEAEPPFDKLRERRHGG